MPIDLCGNQYLCMAQFCETPLQGGERPKTVQINWNASEQLARTIADRVP
jgi:hypothetical protein